MLNQIIIAPLKNQGAALWIFGSRARGDHKKFSDVDLLYQVASSKKLPKGFLFDIQSTLEESDFPFKVDLVNRDEIASGYRDKVESEKIAL